MMTQAEHIAYEQGRVAAKLGFAKQDCPYYEYGLKQAWLDGWEWHWETEM